MFVLVHYGSLLFYKLAAQEKKSSLYQERIINSMKK
jgi:hypothetical protein